MWCCLWQLQDITFQNIFTSLPYNNVYVRAHMCTCACVQCVHMYVCAYAAYVDVCACFCVNMCVHVCVCAEVQVHVHMHICICACVYACVCMLVCIHPCMHGMCVHIWETRFGCCFWVSPSYICGGWRQGLHTYSSLWSQPNPSLNVAKADNFEMNKWVNEIVLAVGFNVLEVSLKLFKSWRMEYKFTKYKKCLLQQHLERRNFILQSIIENLKDKFRTICICSQYTPTFMHTHIQHT